MYGVNYVNGVYVADRWASRLAFKGTRAEVRNNLREIYDV